MSFCPDELTLSKRDIRQINKKMDRWKEDCRKVREKEPKRPLVKTPIDILWDKHKANKGAKNGKIQNGCKSRRCKE